jgi:hypothetical protein
VTLADIKKDYALILATLKVAPRFDMRVLDSELMVIRASSGVSLNELPHLQQVPCPRRET